MLNNVKKIVKGLIAKLPKVKIAFSGPKNQKNQKIQIKMLMRLTKD